MPPKNSLQEIQPEKPSRHKTKFRVLMWQGWEPLNMPIWEAKIVLKHSSACSSAPLCLPRACELQKCFSHRFWGLWSETKNQPKEEVFGRTSLRTSGQTLRSGPPNPGKKTFWHGRVARTSTNNFCLKNFGPIFRSLMALDADMPLDERIKGQVSNCCLHGNRSQGRAQGGVTRQPLKTGYSLDWSCFQGYGP